MWQRGRTFESTSHAPGDARRFVRDCLNAWGLDQLSEPTLLAVSELMTNAVTHGQGRIALTLRGTDDRIHVSVADEGESTPVMLTPDPEHRISGGWGLHLVNTLADDWGFDTRDHRTVVWFKLATRQSDSRGP